MNLSNCKENTEYVVSEIASLEQIDNLFEYGINLNEIVKVIAKAPFKGAIFIEIDSIRFAIRHNIAELIKVKKRL